MFFYVDTGTISSDPQFVENDNSFQGRLCILYPCCDYCYWIFWYRS